MKKYCKIMFLMSFVVLCFQNVFAGNWVQNGDTWMYQNDDGTYVEDQQNLLMVNGIILVMINAC